MILPSYHKLVILLNKYKDRLKNLKLEDPLTDEVPSLEIFKDAKEKVNGSSR